MGMMRLPNLLTFLRFALIPVWAVLVYSEGTAGRAWGFGLFIFAMLTDLADGFIARRTGQTSTLGTFLDMAADKINELTALFVLADLNLIPLWMAILMMAREFVMVELRSVEAFKGQVVGPNFMGKLGGWPYVVCICLGLGVRAFGTGRPIGRLIVTWPMGFALLLSWVRFFVSLWRNRGLLGSRGA